MIETALSVVISIAVTWFLAHIYYQKGTKETAEIVNRLPDVVAKKLAAETRRRLTVEELEELIHEADAYPTEFGVFPNHCPRCGAPTTIRGHGPGEYADGDAWPVCTQCGWGGS